MTSADHADEARDWIAFLQEAMPRLQLRWRGFRKVRRQVEKRIARRIQQLGLGSLADHRRHLDERPDEWSAIDACCRVTISRFYRDHGVFEMLERELLPPLAARARGEDGVIRCGAQAVRRARSHTRWRSCGSFAFSRGSRRCGCTSSRPTAKKPIDLDAPGELVQTHCLPAEAIGPAA